MELEGTLAAPLSLNNPLWILKRKTLVYGRILKLRNVWKRMSRNLKFQQHPPPYLSSNRLHLLLLLLNLLPLQDLCPTGTEFWPARNLLYILQPQPRT